MNLYGHILPEGLGGKKQETWLKTLVSTIFYQIAFTTEHCNNVGSAFSMLNKVVLCFSLAIIVCENLPQVSEEEIQEFRY